MVTALIIIFSVLAVISLMIGWHILFPIIGGAIIITSGIWFFILVAIVLFGLAIMLLVALVRVSILMLTLPLVLLTIIGVLLFPVLFPILVPMLLIFIVIAILRNANKKRVTHDKHKIEQ